LSPRQLGFLVSERLFVRRVLLALRRAVEFLAGCRRGCVAAWSALAEFPKPISPQVASTASKARGGKNGIALFIAAAERMIDCRPMRMLTELRRFAYQSRSGCRYTPFHVARLRFAMTLDRESRYRSRWLPPG
jgi:hypothetical protein